MKRFAVLLLLLFGCPDDPPDANLPDAGPVDTGVVEKTWVFEIDDVAGPSVVLSNPALTDDRLEVDIVGRGLSEVHGLAFRIEFDPAALGYESLTQGAGWTHTGLWEIATPRDGLVVFAASAIGAAPGIAIDGAVIGRVAFARIGAGTTVAIKRTVVQTPDGAKPFAASGAALLVER